MSDSSVCAACGARLKQGASHCDLCGQAVGTRAVEVDALTPVSPEPDRPGARPSTESEATRAMRGTKVCPACAAPSPAAARFCYACGAALSASTLVPERPKPGQPGSSPEAIPKPVAGPASESTAAVNRQVMLLVGVSVLAVVAFFLLSIWGPEGNTDAEEATSQVSRAPVETAPPVVAERPLDPQAEAAAEPLIAAVESAATSEERAERQRELSEFYRGIGRFDRSVQIREDLAREAPSAEAWAEVGNDYYDWMEQSQGDELVRTAKQAIAAYERSLELDPDNLDVRTDMAIAYLNDPDNPMKAIQETGKVLEIDPEHPQANFNRGVMLTLIGRYDEAIAQYARVQEITEPGSYIHEEAGKRRTHLEASFAQP